MNTFRLKNKSATSSESNRLKTQILRPDPVPDPIADWLYYSKYKKACQAIKLTIQANTQGAEVISGFYQNLADIQGQIKGGILIKVQ